jgi:hypothetical protein
MGIRDRQYPLTSTQAVAYALFLRESIWDRNARSIGVRPDFVRCARFSEVIKLGSRPHPCVSIQSPRRGTFTSFRWIFAFFAMYSGSK